MAIQQRAERTRQEILSAAARVFDGLGYERASLARIAGEARVTTGALVFHFATKADLATAVRGRARAVTRTTVESACLSTEGVGGTAIDKLVLTTHALIRLFETDHAARAGERLARELDATGPLPSSGDCPWRREVARLARYAAAEQALRPGVDATAVAALIGYVITGVELEMRSPSAAADDETWPPTGTGAILGPAEERLRRIWELILPGLVHPATRRPRPTKATVKTIATTTFPAPTAFPSTAAAQVTASAPLTASVPATTSAPLTAAAPAMTSAPLTASVPATTSAPLTAAAPAPAAAPAAASAPASASAPAARSAQEPGTSTAMP
ncbi:TetR family transcriptional regulator [Streptomyces sp. NPDC056169]|uniref:TetR family transcriptional regulator n=1 Tax=Streptomyces sp. NPDC056169 TaxID=3345734 RepID=UPI0035DA8E47